MSVEFYSTDTDHGTISVLAKQGAEYGVVKQIKVGNAPRGAVKFTKSGRGFVSNTSGCTVSEISALTHEEVRRITVGFGPRGIGIVPGDRFLLVSNSGSDTMSIVDIKENLEVRQIQVGTDPRHMSITMDGKYAYVCLWKDGKLAKLDISGLAVGDFASVSIIGRIDLGEHSNPYSLNIEASGKYAVVACNATDHVPVVDLEIDAVAHRVSVDCDDGFCGARAVAFSADSKTAYVTLERSNSVAVISLDGFGVERYIPVGSAPRGIIRDGNVIGIVNFARGGAGSGIDYGEFQFAPHSVTFVDLKAIVPGNAVTAVAYSQVRVGHGPCSISAFDPATVATDAASKVAASVAA